MRILQATVALFGAFTFACGSSVGGSGGATTTAGGGGTNEASGSTTTSAVGTTTSSAPPITPFMCGAATCQGTEYCMMTSPGTSTGGPTAYYTCHPLPDACLPHPACGCVDLSMSSCQMSSCIDDAAGHLTYSCPLP